MVWDMESAVSAVSSTAAVIDPTGDYEFELMLDAPRQAWVNRAVETGTDVKDFHDAYQELDRSPYPALQGEGFDFGDEEEMRRRLPGLAEIHL